MSDNSKIEWTEATWNPVRGCTKVSPGCAHCYAETFAERWRGVPGHAYEQGFDLRIVPLQLVKPLHWKRPRRIFVNSMSDLFHKDVPDKFIDAVFVVMEACSQHTFQVLTKRAERMRQYVGWRYGKREGGPGSRIPARNVWLGVSVENQKYADERIPHLLNTPAAVRFLSCEPLLGPIDIGSVRDNGSQDALCFVDWVIVGGESGPKARPMHPDWAHSIRAQCVAAGVPFFFKQWGEYAPAEEGLMVHSSKHKEFIEFTDGVEVYRVGKKAAGRELNGRTYDEFPQPPVPR